MMNFWQACEYVMATGADACCEMPWTIDGEPVGTQRWYLCAADPSPHDSVWLVRLRLRRFQADSQENHRFDAGPFDPCQPLPTEVLQVAGEADLRLLRYFGCESDCHTT